MNGYSYNRPNQAEVDKLWYAYDAVAKRTGYNSHATEQARLAYDEAVARQQVVEQHEPSELLAAVPEWHRQNFETLRHACMMGDLALMTVRHKVTHRQVSVIVAVDHDKKGEANIVPLAQMIDGDPYEQYDPEIAEPSSKNVLSTRPSRGAK